MDTEMCWRVFNLSIWYWGKFNNAYKYILLLIFQIYRAAVKKKEEKNVNNPVCSKYTENISITIF